MSRARDTWRYQSSDSGKEDEHVIERDNTIMYGVVLVIAAVGIVLSIVFWAF